jgi:hypothetical protein
MFISRIELLPEDETTNEHDEAKRAEAQQIDADKGPGGEGLFKGAFKNAHLDPWQSGPPRAIRDYEDGVDRCPICAWELEEGACEHCGYNDSDEDDSDESDDTRALPTPSLISINTDLDADLDEDDHDLDEYDEDDGFVHADRRHNVAHPYRRDIPNPYRYTFPPQRVRYGESMISDDDDDDEDDEEDDEEDAGRLYSNFHGTDDGESDEQSDGGHTAVPDEHTDGTGTNDDDDIMESSEEDSDEESGVITGARRRRHERMRPSERDETPSAAEPESPGSFYAAALAAGDTGYGFSPTRSTSPAASDRGPLRVPSPNTESDEDVRVQRRRRAAATNSIPRRPARVVISSDEESDRSIPTPPRPVAERRAHLWNQRARRGGRGRGGAAYGPYSGGNNARQQFREQVRR